MEAMGVANVAPPGQIPDTVRYAFWFGGLALFLAVLWTIVATREYSPEEMAAFEPPAAPNAPIVRPLASRGHIRRAARRAAAPRAAARTASDRKSTRLNSSH